MLHTLKHQAPRPDGYNRKTRAQAQPKTKPTSAPAPAQFLNCAALATNRIIRINPERTQAHDLQNLADIVACNTQRFEWALTNLEIFMTIPQFDFSDDVDLKKTAKQVAGTAAAVGAVALLPIEAPIILVGAVALGVGTVAAKTVGALWDWITD